MKCRLGVLCLSCRPGSKFTVDNRCGESEVRCISMKRSFRQRSAPRTGPLRFRSGQAFDSAELRSAPYEQGWLRVEVSRPFDRKKPKGRGTELLLRIEHGVHRKINSLEAGRAAQGDRSVFDVYFGLSTARDECLAENVWNPSSQMRGEIWDSNRSGGPIWETGLGRSNLQPIGLGRVSCLDRFLCLCQFIKDCAVLDHRGAKLFCGGFNAAGADGDAVGHAVVFHDARIGDRNIGCALVEAGSRIAAGLKE